jgi:hypothetical protein
MKKVSLIIALLLLCAALFSGCTFTLPTAEPTLAPGVTASPAPTVGPKIEPEQLISKQEAEELVGNSLKEGTKESLASDGMELCFYDAPSKDKHFLQISIYQAASMPSATQNPLAIFNSLISATPQASVAPSTTPLIHQVVTGIGDQALIAPPGIHIAYSGYYIAISVGDQNIPANQEILKKAGLKAVENLKKLIGK